MKDPAAPPETVADPVPRRVPLEERLAAELVQIRARNLYRTRRAVAGQHGTEIHVDGRRCVNFCSNDYLGLAADPRVSEAAKLALDAQGTGSGAAALVSGYNVEHRRLEEALADFLRRPRALLFSSGWAANLGVMKALLSRDDVVVADELNHASLIDGARLSHARYVRVGHRDIDAYAAALADPAHAATPLVVTDSVFSMDGDLAPLRELARLCRQQQATLMVDDAHGFGVLGEGGRGALHVPAPPAPSKVVGRIGVPGQAEPAAALRVEDVPVYMATLGKSLGVAGAFVAGSEALIEYLIQRARTWVFSTAPPPALAAAARRSLEIVRAEPERRQHLFRLVERFRRGAQQLGLPVSGSSTPIQPMILGPEERALSLSRWLFERGFWVAAIRPPTVPAGTSRLRITLSAAHQAGQVDGLLDAIATGLRTLDR